MVEDFRSKVLAIVDMGSMCATNAELLWNNMADTIREMAKTTLGISKGKAKEHRESWWLNEEVRAKIKKKQTCFKELLLCNGGEEKTRAIETYKEAKREVKKTVAIAKARAYEEMYKRLDSKEGQNGIYKLAKSREKRRKDLGSIKYIKDDNGHVLVNEDDIKRTWRSYFYSLFNEDSSHFRDRFFEGTAEHILTVNDCLTSRIVSEEVKLALKRMGRDKVVGPDQIPIFVWLCLGEDGVQWLTKLFNIIVESSTMPEEWRSSIVIPIYKNKGDAQSVAIIDVLNCLLIQ